MKALTGKSHALIGGVAGYLLGGPVGAAIASFGALLPDIDHPGSTISRRFFPKGTYSKTGRITLAAILIVASFQLQIAYLGILGLGVMALAFIPHRGILHTPLFVLILAALAGWQFSDLEYTKYLLIGYVSHIFADSLTSEGLPLLWPISNKRLGLTFFKTGGLGEYLLVGLVLAIFYLIQQKGLI